MKNLKLIALALVFVAAACSNSGTGTVGFSLTAPRLRPPHQAPP
jgi:hypothetical protein